MANNFEISEGDKGSEQNSGNLVATDFLFNKNLLKAAADVTDVTTKGFPSLDIGGHSGGFSPTSLLKGAPPETPSFNFKPLETTKV